MDKVSILVNDDEKGHNLRRRLDFLVIFHLHNITWPRFVQKLMIEALFDLKGGRATVAHTCLHTSAGRILQFPRRETLKHKQEWQKLKIYSNESHVFSCLAYFW